MNKATGSLLSAIALALAAPAILAANSAPVAVPLSHNVPDAADVPYPGGTLGLSIDATDVTRGVYRVTESIPVAPGTRQLTLLFPQWLPGNHGPRGTLAELVALTFEAGGQKLEWKRDPIEVNAFHIALPAGTREVTARFIHTSPLQTAEGRITMTCEFCNYDFRFAPAEVRR